MNASPEELLQHAEERHERRLRSGAVDAARVHEIYAALADPSKHRELFPLKGEDLRSWIIASSSALLFSDEAAAIFHPYLEDAWKSGAQDQTAALLHALDRLLSGLKLDRTLPPRAAYDAVYAAARRVAANQGAATDAHAVAALDKIGHHQKDHPPLPPESPTGIGPVPGKPLPPIISPCDSPIGGHH